MVGPVNANAAAAAYAKTAQAGTGPRLEARDGNQEDFSDLIKSAIRSAIDTQKRAETISTAAVQDRADMTQVITAVAEAEVTLQAVVTVRDKVIEAYREIIRMSG